MSQKAALVVGTFDTKSEELNYIVDVLSASGVTVKTVDLSTSKSDSSADYKPADIAASHPDGAGAVFTGDRGTSVAAMAKAFEIWTTQHAPDIAGMISAGGSGGTALSTPAMRALSIGVPKVMVSTVASGNVEPYVGPSDMVMMYSVTDVQGLNGISRKVLGNAAGALSGMLLNVPETPAQTSAQSVEKPGLGLTMFGVTTTAVQAVLDITKDTYEPFVFHATGVGGRSMEKLIDSDFLDAVIDLTTTEVCDLMMGGVFAATEDRFGAIIRKKIPYVGSVGALDMVNFGAPETVPAHYSDRDFYEHNPQVTLMRTTPEENTKMGAWIAGRLNKMEGPVRFLLPEGGVSALDAPDMPFWNPEARDALYSALESDFSSSKNRQIIRVPNHINDPEFAQAAVDALTSIT